MRTWCFTFCLAVVSDASLAPKARRVGHEKIVAQVDAAGNIETGDQDLSGQHDFLTALENEGIDDYLKVQHLSRTGMCPAGGKGLDAEYIDPVHAAFYSSDKTKYNEIMNACCADDCLHCGGQHCWKSKGNNFCPYKTDENGNTCTSGDKCTCVNAYRCCTGKIAKYKPTCGPGSAPPCNLPAVDDSDVPSGLFLARFSDAAVAPDAPEINGEDSLADVMSGGCPSGGKTVTDETAGSIAKAYTAGNITLDSMTKSLKACCPSDCPYCSTSNCWQSSGKHKCPSNTKKFAGGPNNGEPCTSGDGCTCENVHRCCTKFFTKDCSGGELPCNMA